MPNAAQALAHLDSLKSSLNVDWLNIGRVSEDWKTRIYEQKSTGLQFAIYNRKTSITVLLERQVEDIEGAVHLPARPKGDSLNIAKSHFTQAAGSCYEVTDELAMERLLRSMRGMPQARTIREIVRR